MSAWIYRPHPSPTLENGSSPCGSPFVQNRVRDQRRIGGTSMDGRRGVARLVSGALTSGHAGISKECTFESSFVVQVRQRTDRPKTGALQSKPANTSTRQQGPRKTAKPDRTSLASVPERNTTTKEAKPRLTEEEERERRRARTAARRQRQLELGLCVSCSNEPIEGQTRCPECAERHRQHWQNWQPKRKTAQRDGPPKVPALTD